MINIYTLLTSETNEALSGIELAISSIPDGSYILATYSGVVSGISALFAAWILNYYTSNKINKKNEISKITNVVYKKSEDLENHAIKYWLKGSTKKNKTEMLNLEINIKSDVVNIQAVLDDLYLKDELLKKDRLRLEVLNDEIYDFVTGGDFEVLGRIPSAERAMDIAITLSEFKLILLRYNNYG
jgi:hypothetical protein